MRLPTDGELACHNIERAIAAEISALIYKLRCEGKTDAQIILLVLQQLDIIRGL